MELSRQRQLSCEVGRQKGSLSYGDEPRSTSTNRWEDMPQFIGDIGSHSQASWDKLESRHGVSDSTVRSSTALSCGASHLSP